MVNTKEMRRLVVDLERDLAKGVAFPLGPGLNRRTVREALNVLKRRIAEREAQRHFMQ